MAEPAWTQSGVDAFNCAIPSRICDDGTGNLMQTTDKLAAETAAVKTAVSKTAEVMSGSDRGLHEQALELQKMVRAVATLVDKIVETTGMRVQVSEDADKDLRPAEESEREDTACASPIKRPRGRPPKGKQWNGKEYV